MSQQRHVVDQVMVKLRRGDVLLGKRAKVPDVCKQLEITDQTYYYWRQKYGGRQPTMAKLPTPEFSPVLVTLTQVGLDGDWAADERGRPRWW